MFLVFDENCPVLTRWGDGDIRCPCQILVNSCLNRIPVPSKLLEVLKFCYSFKQWIAQKCVNWFPILKPQQQLGELAAGVNELLGLEYHDIYVLFMLKYSY